MASAVPSSTRPGTTFGKYVVARMVAEGGMATIYEARHQKLGTRVALKVLSRFLRDQPDVVQRFEREARAAAALESPYVAKVLDVDTTDDGRPYMIMEFLDGRDLEKELQARGALPVDEAVSYMIEACAALAVAHQARIVHRDLKPANIFLAQEGTRRIVKVLDFGISKIPENGREISATQTHTVLGTPLYMSPEQVRSARDVDARSDIWSLGVILYEAITGQPPFLRENASAVIAAIVTDVITPPREIRPDLPVELERTIMTALQRDPSRRYQSVAALAQALTPFAPKWFSAPTVAGEALGRALPRELTTSLSEGMDSERTIADPDFAPDALRPQQPIVIAPPPPMPLLPTVPEFAPTPPPAPVPDAIRTTVGKSGRELSLSAKLAIAIASGVIVGSIGFAIVVILSHR